MVRRISLTLLVRLLLILSILSGFIPSADARRRRRKSVKSEVDVEEEIQFNSKDELDSKLDEFRKKRKSSALQEDISPDQLRILGAEESKLKKSLMKAVLDHGEDSKQKADALHSLGRNIYKQGRYSEVVDISKEIVRIHEVRDGPEHLNTANALGNVGAVAFRVGDASECHYAMNRALYIFIQTYGADSKEVRNLIHAF